MSLEALLLVAILVSYPDSFFPFVFGLENPLPNTKGKKQYWDGENSHPNAKGSKWSGYMRLHESVFDRALDSDFFLLF